MSRENVEIVRRVYDAVSRRDSDTVLALYDPEVELDFTRTIGDVMGRGLYRGHEGVRSWSRDWYEAWDSYADDCKELIDGGEHVISVVSVRARGRTSGAQLDWTHYGVWTIREGKIVRLVWFPTRAEALEAVGLSE